MPGRQGQFGALPQFVATLVALSCLFALASCGGSGDPDVTLKIGFREAPEEEVLGSIYAEALRRVGYTVKEKRVPTGLEDAPLEELKAGRISGYPDHLDTVLDLVHPTFDAQPADPEEAQRLAQDKLRKDGLVVMPPATFSRNRQVAFLTTAAARHNLQEVSDLRGKSESMTVQGPTDCHFAMDCLAGFEKLYGVYFESISYTYTPAEVRNRFKVLDEGKFDASFVGNTDGQLYKDKGRYTLLKDDKGVLPAGNVVFVTDEETAEEAGEEFEATIAAAQKGLTLTAMQRMNAEVDLEGKDPALVAKRYLQGIQLPG